MRNISQFFTITAVRNLIYIPKVFFVFKKPIIYLRDYLMLHCSKDYYTTRGWIKVVAKNGDDLWTIFEIFVKQEYGSDFSQCKTIVDIGANTGIATMRFAANSNAVIYSVDPFKKCIDQIKENIALNHFSQRIHPIISAVSNYDGEAILYTTNQTLTSSLHKWFAGDQNNSLKVKTTKIMTLMRDAHIENIDLLKLDCEGSEYEIIESLDKDTAEKIKEMRIEYHNIDNNRTGNSLISNLESKWYQIIKKSLHTDQRDYAWFIWAKYNG